MDGRLELIVNHLDEIYDADEATILEVYNILKLKNAITHEERADAIKNYIITHMAELSHLQKGSARRRTQRKNRFRRNTRSRQQRGGMFPAGALRSLARAAAGSVAVAGIATAASRFSSSSPLPSFKMPALPALPSFSAAASPFSHTYSMSPVPSFLNVSRPPVVSVMPLGGAGSAASNALPLNSVADPAAKARVIEFRAAHNAYVTKGVSRPNRPASNLCASGTIDCGTYPRSIMPQIKDIGIAEFIKRLQDIDPRVSMVEDKMKVTKMTFSQSEVDRDRALRKKDKFIEQGKLKRKNAIVVSNDGYIVDGHHTAAGILLAGAGDEKVHIVKINKPIKWILEASAAVGVPRAGV